MPTLTVSQSPPVTKRRYWVEIAGLMAVTFGLYAATLSPNFALTHDSIAYLLEIERGDGEDFYHPHHLLYNPASAVWLGFWQSLGVGMDGAFIIALLNSLAGAVTVGIVFALLRRRMGLPFDLSLAGASLVALSFGVWFYSVAIEVYLIPLAFLLGMLYVLTADRLTLAHILGVGLLHGLAMVFHQAHVLFGPVVLLALWLRRDQLGASWGRAAVQYVAAGSALVIAAYGAVLLAVVQPATVNDAWMWLTSYGHDSSYWNPPALSTAFKAAVGLTRAFIGMHFIFALEPIQLLMERIFPDKYLLDEVFLVENLTVATAYVLFGLSAVIGLALLTGLALGLRRLRRLPRERRYLMALIGLWFGIYAAFFFFWEPHNVEFWIPQSVCLWLALVILWGDETDRRPRPALLLGALAALLFVVNYVGSIRPAQDPERDIYRYMVNPLVEVAGPDDLVVLGRRHIIGGYVERIVGADVVAIDRMLQEMPDPASATAALRSEIDARHASGRQVVVLDSAVELEPQVTASLGAGAERFAANLWAPYVPTWQPHSPRPNVTYYLLPDDAADD